MHREDGWCWRTVGLTSFFFKTTIQWLHKMVWLVGRIIWPNILLEHCRTLFHAYLADFNWLDWRFACWFSCVCLIIAERCNSNNFALGKYRKRTFCVKRTEGKLTFSMVIVLTVWNWDSVFLRPFCSNYLFYAKCCLNFGSCTSCLKSSNFLWTAKSLQESKHRFLYRDEQAFPWNYFEL